jgi:N-acetyl-gamma-glutamyl-phosphate reductase
MTNVFIDGEQGTTGLQIHDRLRGRSDITLMTLPVSHRKDTRLRAGMLNNCDIAILCLPDEAAREAVAWWKTRTCGLSMPVQPTGLRPAGHMVFLK